MGGPLVGWMFGLVGLFFFLHFFLNVIGSRWWWSKLLELLIIYMCWIVMDFHPFLVGRFLWQTFETRENNQGVFGALTKLSIYGQVRVSLQESNVSVGGWAMKKGPLVVTGYRQGIILPRLYGDCIYYNKPFWRSLLNNQDSMKSQARCFSLLNWPSKKGRNLQWQFLVGLHHETSLWHAEQVDWDHMDQIQTPKIVSSREAQHMDWWRVP